MQQALWVGTTEGLHELGEHSRITLAGHEVSSLTGSESGWWAITDGRQVRRREKDGEWKQLTSSRKQELHCMMPTPAGLFVGTSKADLFQLRGRTLQPVRSFADTPGREDWYTPWGGPPDVRSISIDLSGALYVNVHVEGVIRSTDEGKTWESTIDQDSDVHQVLFDLPSGLLLAASARGLAVSHDGGESWRVHDKGLHATYLRAVAVAGETILVTASTGPWTNHAAVYRSPLPGDGEFERCRDGLPDRFSHNIDTFCLAAEGPAVVFGTEEGSVFFSADEGLTWTEAAGGLPPMRCVALA